MGHYLRRRSSSRSNRGPETLLALKLHAAGVAAISRPPTWLYSSLTAFNTTASEAEMLNEAYYPGDALNPRTTQLVNQILFATPPAQATPPLPDLASRALARA